MAQMASRVAARYKQKKDNPNGGDPIYLYSEGQIAKRNKDKAERLEKLSGSINKLRAQVRKDLKSEDRATALTALAVALMDETAERVGNETSKEGDNEDGKPHYGVTTWQKSHVSFSGGKATIKYTGKSGVKQEKTVSDKAILAALRKAYDECGKDGIFCHEETKIDASKVNAYLKDFDITAKDIRGLHCNASMKKALKKIRSKGGKLPEDKKEREAKLKKEFDAALEEVAEDVGGHEASTLRNQYLIPSIETDYLKDGTVSNALLASISVVARYKQAEILTKSWVMGIRRTWLKLMSPTINNWGDVRKAFRQLELFVERLDDEIFFNRRGPYVGTPTMSTGKEAKKLLDQLKEMIRSAKDKAEHWQNVDEKGGMANFRKEDGEGMFRLYKLDFASATEESIEGKGGKYRNIKLTEALDPLLKILREEAALIQHHDIKNPDSPYEDTSVAKEFDLYGMKVVVDDRTVTAGDIQQYIKYLDEAYQRLKQKGFAKVWYGTVFIQCESCGGTNSYGAELGVGGNYPIGPDVVNVFSRPGRFIVELMAHELGHRFWFKQMTPAQRGKFESLIRIEGKEPTWEDAHRVLPTDLQYAHKAVSDAVAPLRTLLKEFRASRIKWWPDMLKRFEQPMSQASSSAVNDLQTAMQKVHTWLARDAEVNQLRESAWAAGSAMRRIFWDVKQDITATIHAIPDPTEPIPDLDAYWPKVFKPIQAAWIEKAEQAIDAAVAEADIYIDFAVKAHNEAADARVKKQRDDWEEKKRLDQRSVLPVSNYGGKHIEEAWAEVFAYYILDKSLSRDQLESFKSIFKTSALVERFKAARTDTIDAAWVENLRKDFLTLMKNLPRVNSYAQAVELRDAFVLFRSRFRKFFFDDFLNQHKDEGDGSFEGLRKPAWDFYAALEFPFYLADEHVSEGRALVMFQEKVPAWERRLRTKAQTFWKDLKDTLSYRQDGKTEVQTPDVDRLVLEGFQVEIRGYDATSDWQGESFAKIKEALRQYRRKAAQALPWLLKKQLPLVLNFESKLNEGGEYKRDHIVVAMAALAGESPEWGVHILAHEMGHHLFKILDSSAREFWSTAIRQDYGPLDVDELLDKWPENLKWSSDFVTYMATRDPVLALQVDVLAYGKGGDKRYEKRQDFEDAYSPTLPVPKNPITGYAGKNPEESFCEAVGRLVGYGPATVLPQVRQWLDIVIPGDVKVARLMRRYLACPQPQV